MMSTDPVHYQDGIATLEGELQNLLESLLELGVCK